MVKIFNRRTKRRFKRAYDFVKAVIQEFGEDRGSLFAAAISFFGLLSIIPLILLAVGVFGMVIGSYETALERVFQFAGDFLPAGDQAFRQEIQAIIEQSGILSGIGLLGLLWTGSQVFVILQMVMNAALGAEQRIGFIRGRLMAIVMVIVVGALFALSIGITSLLTAIRSFEAEIWGLGTADLESVWDFLGILLPVFISALAFTFVYKYLPMRNIGLKGPLIGGITGGIFFEIAKHAFSWYVSNVADFARIYGSLGSVIILVLWVYYVSMIMVLGAELVSVYIKRMESSA